MPKQKLLYQDKLFADEVIKTKDPTLAILNLHPEIKDKKQASAMARYKLASSNEIKRYISDALDRQGLSLLELNNRLKRNLDATKPIVVKDEIVDYPDYNVRLATIEKGYKLHGLLKNDIVQDNRQVNVTLSAMNEVEQAKLSEILTEMSQLADRLDLTKNKVQYQQPIDTQGDTKK